MIASYSHKGLRELFYNGTSAKIADKMHARAIRILDALTQATKPEDLNIPGLKFHALNGFTPTRYAVSVNGPWRITFEFDGEDACRVDFEQYH